VLIPGNVLSLTSVKENKNYYHTVLEKLFFQVLNTPLKDRGEEFKTGPFANLPFLNGGLFEPHQDDFYELNELSGTSKYDSLLIVPDNWMEDGLLKQLGRISDTYVRNIVEEQLRDTWGQANL
jgi:hypothetical protein